MKEKHENDNGDEKSGILTVYPQININGTKKLTYVIYQLLIIQSIRRIRNKTNTRSQRDRDAIGHSVWLPEMIMFIDTYFKLHLAFTYFYSS